MKTRSAKAKGHRLEKWLLNELLSICSDLTADDIRIPVGAETGADLKLSKKAQERIGYGFECKNREIFKTLYGFYDQAISNTQSPNEPVLIIKMNNREPLAIINAKRLLFMTLKGTNA